MDIITWESEVIAMVQSKRSSLGMAKQFRSFSDYLTSDENTKRILRYGPDKTDGYLNVFCPQIIDEILRSGAVKGTVEKDFEEILRSLC